MVLRWAFGFVAMIFMASASLANPCSKILAKDHSTDSHGVAARRIMALRELKSKYMEILNVLQASLQAIEKVRRDQTGYNGFISWHRKGEDFNYLRRRYKSQRDEIKGRIERINVEIFSQLKILSATDGNPN